MSDYGRECQNCNGYNDKHATYCEKCGEHLDKWLFEQMRELDAIQSLRKDERPKKGSFEKNFFRGKK